MTAERANMEIVQVGTVHSPIKDAGNLLPEDFRGTESVIEVFEEYREALDGLEEEEYITVVFYFHRSEENNERNGHRYEMKVHPRGDVNNPLKGVFATCSPRRPNLIGISRCALLKIEGRFLTVRDLDAIDQTPLIDIKPYRLNSRM